MREKEIITYGKSELRRILEIEGEIEALGYRLWERAIPQYYTNHRDILSSINNLPVGICLAGDYLNGAGVENSALSGKLAMRSLYEDSF